MAALIDSGEIKQIIVVAGGRSDMGVSPVEAAERAFAAGIIVSTIKIIDIGDSSDEEDTEEAERIAEAGGGLCEYTHIEDLGRTMQSLAKKTARRTIELIVARQLKAIMGQELENIEPKSRLKIADFIEKYGEGINLKCIIALDTGKNMKNKLAAAGRSIEELLASLRDRRGNSSIAVIGYPGEDSGMCRVICGFTNETGVLREKLEVVSSGAGTPTGPAILKACEMLFQYYEVSGADISGDYEALQYYV